MGHPVIVMMVMGDPLRTRRRNPYQASAPHQDRITEKH